jgi:hypothetical protein
VDLIRSVTAVSSSCVIRGVALGYCGVDGTLANGESDSQGRPERESEGGGGEVFC